ncbi:hypothetical protein HRG_013573 [Hirsutella rhossiliensis]
MAKPTNEGSSVKQADDRSSPRPAEEDDAPRLPDAVQQRRPKRNRVSLNPKDNHSQLADQLQQLPEALNAWKWSIRFLKLMRDKSKEALDTFTVRDKEACEALEDLLSTSVLIKSAYAKYWLYHKPASRTSNMCLHGEQWWKKPILCRNPQRTT